jgi:hypothetical protein
MKLILLTISTGMQASTDLTGLLRFKEVDVYQIFEKKILYLPRNYYAIFLNSGVETKQLMIQYK